MGGMLARARPGRMGAWAALLCWAAAAPVAGQTVRGDLSLLGQVREGDQTREREVPLELYGDLGAAHRGSRGETSFRLGRDLAIDDGESDFYAGFAHAAGVIPGVDLTLGRQFMSEGPGGAFVADAGKVRFALGGPFALTVFGGAPRYFEPTYGPEIQSRDDILFGGSLDAARLWGTDIRVGYLQLEREGEVLRQLLTATVRRSFHHAPGMPDLYGSFAWDADRQHLDRITAGTDLFLLPPRLTLNLEASYYKPQDNPDGELSVDLERREDAIFELFSLSELVQVRGGLRYSITPAFSFFADYSYQRYDRLPPITEVGHIASTGLLWLPFADGLEIVRLEYFALDSDGRVNGGRLFYENRVYDRVVFRTRFDLAGYETGVNEEDVALGGLIALGYSPAPDLLCELDFEANHNDRFAADLRLGFLVTYRFRHAIGRSKVAEHS